MSSSLRGLPWCGHLTANGMLLAVAMLGLGMVVLPAGFTNPVPVQPPAPTLTPSPGPGVTAPNAPSKQLLGQWVAPSPSGNETILLVFAPAGKLFIVSGQSVAGNGIAHPFRYRIDAQSQPMHLDIVLASEATVETLFEFTPEGDLRLQMQGTRPGKPRPSALTNTATVFHRVSHETTLPPGTELETPESGSKRVREQER